MNVDIEIEDIVGYRVRYMLYKSKSRYVIYQAQGAIKALYLLEIRSLKIAVAFCLNYKGWLSFRPERLTQK